MEKGRPNCCTKSAYATEDKLGHRIAREAVADEQRRQQTTRCESRTPEAILDLEEGQFIYTYRCEETGATETCNCNGKKSWISDEGEGKGKTSLKDEEADGRREDDFQPFRNAAEAPRWPAAKEGGLRGQGAAAVREVRGHCSSTRFGGATFGRGGQGTRR
ncbi:hypothetical protein CCMA1212_008776 [Trichoderma ghanense]|uniref:Uncharacterized protein n=1 Tax=Trichoderma ghanense TaxID=65468 RepID=A0ABY2GTS2_9HYPO